jgi:hypothetical protein
MNIMRSEPLDIDRVRRLSPSGLGLRPMSPRIFRRRKHRGVVRDQTSAQTTGVAGVRAAVATALAADRRDRSVWRHTLNPREWRTDGRNREQSNCDSG